MTAKVWPSLLPPKRALFTPEGQSSSGGPSDTGFEQVVIGSAGRWRARVVFDIRPTNEQLWARRLLLGRAMLAHMRGRTNTILIGPGERVTSPGALAAGGAKQSVLSFSDGSFLSDGAGIVQPLTPAVAGPAAMGDAEIMVNMVAGHVPQPGQWFGLKNQELYLIDGATRYINDLNLNYWTLTFTPTLRRDVVDGEWVDFDNPVAEMRSSNDRAFDMDLERLFRGEATLDLVEAVP